jgi:hypothetical protein
MIWREIVRGQLWSSGGRMVISARRVQKKTEICYNDFILQHFKHCPLQSSPLYWRYTVPNVSSIVGMLSGTHFL